ncbi:MAG: glycosyltransferase [Propionicimonas sp.]
MRGVRRRGRQLAGKVRSLAGAQSRLTPDPRAPVASHRDFQPQAFTGSFSDTNPVTVVVTAFNERAYLAQCLWSVQRQHFPHFECLVVDDASTDLSMDIALEFAARDPRFRVLSHEGNAGLGAARNTGLVWAKGEWITFLDGDDFLTADSISARLDAVRTDPGWAGAYCAWSSVPEDAEPPLMAAAAPEKRHATYLGSHWDTPFIASAPLLRRDVIASLGGFNEGLHSAEDFELWSRLLRAGYAVAYAPVVGVAYRQRVASMIRRDPALHVEVYATIHDYLDRALAAAELPGPDPFLLPFWQYQRSVSTLQRRVNFLALAAATGDQDQIDRVLTLIDGHVLAASGSSTVARAAEGYAVRRLGLTSAADAEARLSLRGTLQAAVDSATSQASRGGPEPAVASTPSPVAGPRPVGSCAPLPLDRAVSVFTKSGTAARVRHVARVELVTDPSVLDLENAVLLVPQSRYHVDELGPLLEALRERGRRAYLSAGPGHDAIILNEIGRYTDQAVAWDPELPLHASLDGVVVLNDWGRQSRHLVNAAQSVGAATFAKVEGVQDFEDADTGRHRSAYRTADYVLGQGRNDVAALPDRPVHVVGSSRLERIWALGIHGTDKDDVLVNLNFTYDVMPEAAAPWMRSVEAAANEAGVGYRVSLHPAQPELGMDLPIAVDPLRHELTRCGVLVTRFSTVVFEAMARGVPVIYHNPHGERVPTFQDPRGAFLKTSSHAELVSALHTAMGWRADYRSRARAFFEGQVDVDPALPSADRAADAVVRLMERHRGLGAVGPPIGAAVSDGSP